MYRELPYIEDAREIGRAREVAAALLRALSASLERLAQQMVVVVDAPAARRDAVLEFHAEAGAPEGALYVDGQLVGRLDGVSRL
jgi:hypothetical protein